MVVRVSNGRGVSNSTVISRSNLGPDRYRTGGRRRLARVTFGELRRMGTKNEHGEAVQDFLLVPPLSVDPRFHELEHLLLNLRSSGSEVGVEDSLMKARKKKSSEASERKRCEPDTHLPAVLGDLSRIKVVVVPSLHDTDDGVLDVDTSEHSGGLVEDEAKVILGGEGVSRIGSLRVLELRRVEKDRVSDVTS